MRSALLTYLILLLTSGQGEGRVVQVSEGPLVRVEGQPASLSCNVSGYEGPSEQDFDWKVLHGDRWLQLISTFDLSYADQSLRSRVDAGDITVERLGPASVELRIRSLTAADSTAFRCSTPSTDSVISGNYEADVRLSVLQDSLKVAASTPPAMVPEGGPLGLYCNATRDTQPQGHTHLSVTWSVARGAGPEDVLTFGPDGGVAAGANYTRRLSDGELRLDLRGGGVFGLVLTEALPGDGGAYACTAREWFREVGGAWRQVLQRSVEIGQVDVTPTAQSLTVSVEEDDITLNVGDTLNLTCSVAIDYQPSLGLEVTWLLSPAPRGGPAESRVLAQMSRDGVVRGSVAPVGLSRVEEGAFRLLVRDASRADSGLYACQAAAWIRRSGGESYRAALNSSAPVQVLVAAQEPEFKVVLLDGVTPQYSGEPTELECRVTGVSGLGGGRLGVSWLYAEAAPGDVIGGGSSSVVAELDGEGNLRPGSGYADRVGGGLLTLSRSQPDVFRLRLLHTRDSDMGAYSCAVAVWSPAPLGSWERGKEVHSQPINVFWTSKTPRVSVAARRVREASAAGGTFEMSCQVTGQNLQSPGYSVRVEVEEGVGGRVRKVLSLDPDAVLELEEWSELDRVVLEKTGPAEFRFRLYRAQREDRGFYSCTVTAWTRQPGTAGAPGAWTRSVSSQSNKVHVHFSDTGPVFNISVHADISRVSPWETAKMQCVITILGPPPSADDVSYEVRWFLIRPQAPESAALLASVDRWGVVWKGVRNGSSDCSVERVGARTYALSVHGVQDTDAGAYYCAAAPWLRSPAAAGAWTRGLDITSSRIHLAVDFALWDSMQRPLLVGTGVSLAVGVLAVLLGLICSRCLRRGPRPAPRTHGPRPHGPRPLSHSPLTDTDMELE